MGSSPERSGSRFRAVTSAQRLNSFPSRENRPTCQLSSTKGMLHWRSTLSLRFVPSFDRVMTVLTAEKLDRNSCAQGQTIGELDEEHPRRFNVTSARQRARIDRLYIQLGEQLGDDLLGGGIIATIKSGRTVIAETARIGCEQVRERRYRLYDPSPRNPAGDLLCRRRGRADGEAGQVRLEGVDARKDDFALEVSRRAQRIVYGSPRDGQQHDLAEESRLGRRAYLRIRSGLGRRPLQVGGGLGAAEENQVSSTRPD